MKLAKTMTYGLAAGMLASAVAFTAQAEVVAYSTLQITNFQITSGGNQIDLTQQITVNNATSSRASFDNAPGVSISNPTDTAMSCVGACGGIGQNDFSQVSAGNDTLHFARGDALLSGSLLTSANAYSVAETQLTKNVGSNAGGELSTTSTFWTIEFDGALGDITLEFDALGELLAFSDIPGGFAQADFDWSLTLRDITTSSTGTFVTEFNPEELNQSVAVVGAGQADYSVNDHFVLNVSGLLADRRYRLIISHNSDVEASFEAPEPASMAALGMGLLALGGMAARRRKAA